MRPTGVGILTVCFFALLPFFALPNLLYTDTNSKFFLVLFFTILVAFVFAYRLYKGYGVVVKNRWFLYALSLVLLVQYIAAFLGVFPEHSFWSNLFWSTGLITLTHLAIVAVLLGELLNKADWSAVRSTIAISAGIFAFLSLIGISGFGGTGHFLWIPLGEGNLTLGNETYAGAYLALAFCLGLIEFVNSRKGIIQKKIIFGALILIILSPLILNTDLLTGKTPLSDVLTNPMEVLGGARSSSAAIFVLLVFLGGYLLIGRLVRGQLRRKAQYSLAVLFIGGISIGLALLFSPGSPVQETYIHASTAARIITWDTSREAFLERPLLGWGPENFDRAFEQYFNNRLYEEENIGEVWFERAHNVMFDTLVGSGIFGLSTFVLLILVYIVIVYRARSRGQIGEMEAVILYAIIPLHLLQMQTGFDTIGSYTLLAGIGSYILFLERKDGDEAKLSNPIGKVAAIACVLVAFSSLIFIFIPEYNRQVALVQTFRVTGTEAQEREVRKTFTRLSSFEYLRLSSGSFLNGSIDALKKASSPERNAEVLAFASIYESYYQQYLQVMPDHYRARMNYAYLLLVETALGNNRVDEAKKILTDSYRLSPQNPLTYALDSVAELYGGDLVEARRLMDEALALNPRAGFTQGMDVYLRRQSQAYPEFIVLHLTNL